MKNIQKGFMTPVSVVIVAVLVIGGAMYLYKDKKVEKAVNVVEEQSVDKSNLETNKKPVSSNVILVSELGIKFEVTKDISDLMYIIETIDGTKYAKFTSKSLVDKQIKASSGNCSYGALGTVTLNRKGDGMYVPTGSYERPDDRCSSNSDVEALQYQQIKSLEAALKTAIKI